MKPLVIAALVLLVISAGFGIWTGLLGQPYNTLIFTIHKLSSVGMGILFVLYYLQVMRPAGLHPGKVSPLSVLL